MNKSSNYELLLSKLDAFVRKYYTNQIIRGVLYTIGAVVLLFLVISILEYFFFFGKEVRKLLFFGFLMSTIAMIGSWIVQPVIKFFKLGETISHDQAATIIGNHFYDVKDKLLNVLQLRRQTDQVSDRSLIEASINQKSAEIKPIPFQAAIDLSKNKKYLKFALPPFLFLLVLLFAAPSLIKDSTHRLINNNKEFIKAAPFIFNITNEKLEVVQFGDFTLDVLAEGSVLPEEAFIEINDFRYRLKKLKNGSFSYTFKNVQKETPFRLFSGPVSTSKTILDVLIKPSLSNMTIDLNYPNYTGRKDESIANSGDMIIPEGTDVRWNINAINTDDVTFSFNANSSEAAKRQGGEFFYLDKRVKNNNYYKIYYSNSQIPNPDSVLYNINVIKDQFPTISVEKMVDSMDQTLIYFLGSASDDYGLRELTFNYSVINENGQSDKLMTSLISNPKNRSENYSYVFDINELKLAPGDKVNFYFEIKDNDAVNGSKASKTGIMTYARPSLEQIDEMENVNEEQIKEDILKSLEESKKIQEDLKKLREKLLQKEKADWQDKKEMEKLLEKQNELQKKMEQAKDKFDQNKENREEFKEQTEQFQEKQEKLQELFEKIMDPERQELMEKIQELLQELEKEDMIQMMEQFEQNEMTKEKEMERLLNLFKQLEMEKEIKEMAEKLEKMAEEQENLAEETKEKSKENTEEENKKEEKENIEKTKEEKSQEEKNAQDEEKSLQEEKSQEELKKEQEKLNEEFKEMMEKMEEMLEQNKELSPPKNLEEENKEKMEDIMEDMEQSMDQMEQNQNSKSSKSQKNASQKMKSMASQMMASMESGEMEQMEEDMAALRQLLENLINLSFDQEDLTNNLKATQTPTPRYVELVQNQFKLKNDFSLIRDSLNALSSRVEEIESFVTEKVTEIERNIGKSLDRLEERQVPEAIENQRFTMKNVNDLALMLDESMQNMQQQMAGMMAGSQMCNKPGGQSSGKSGSIPMDKITEGQQGMGEKLNEMQQKQGKGQGLSSKDFAEAAARQAALRKALQEMNQSKQEQGKGAQELQEIIDQMDKIETDLVNKKLDNELLMRQQEILTRLLEAEKAEQQREFDNKRKAEQANERRKELPPSLQDYLKKRESEIEMYKTISPNLKPYYKILVDGYYRALKGEK